MSTLKRVFGLIALCALMATMPARAVDLTALGIAKTVGVIKPWTGLYLGVNGGYGWQENGTQVAGTDALSSALLAVGIVPGHFADQPRGPMFGGQIGLNYQIGNMVLGVETDLDWARVRNMAAETSAGLGTSTTNAQLDWFGTTRFRAGFLLAEPWLVYGTAGVAYGGVHGDVSNNFLSSTIDNAKIGWTLGAGTELAFAAHWSAKLEYLYYDLGKLNWSATAGGGGPPVTFALTDEMKGSLIRAGVNYKF